MVAPCVGGTPTCKYGEGLAVGWRALHGQRVAFPFGHGFSYTTFEFGWGDAASLPAAVASDATWFASGGGASGSAAPTAEPAVRRMGSNEVKQLLRRTSSFGNPAIGRTSLSTPDLFTLPDGVEMSALRQWDFGIDLFTTAERIQIAAVLLRDAGVLEQCNVPTEPLANLLKNLSEKYHPHPYHNFTHSVHVLHGCYMLITQGMVDAKCAQLNNLERLSLMLAALGHDVDHPGVNNAFMISTTSRLALLYNDVSVLENHHAATVCLLLSEKENDVLGHMAPEERRACRKIMIKSILATDMAKHADMVKDLSECAAQSRAVEPVDVTQHFLHLADLGNCVVAWEHSKRWAHRVCEETTAQLRRETALGLPVPPQAKMDAYTDPEMAARQLVFLDGWVRPLFRAAALIFPGIKCRLDQIETNRRICEEEMAKLPK
mmetsp:Transcript_72262/g.197867  ORF Transcript_72262/g.197867 Transcript_72262/m.197867 type:complete len:433 (+) Transcript_72262:1737-3035(+)